MVQGDIGAELASAIELLGARGGDDRACSQRPAELECREGDASPIPQISTHSPSCNAAFVTSMRCGLEHEREGCGLLERERFGERVELSGRDRLEFAIRPIGVLPDDGDTAVVDDPRVDDNAIAHRKLLDAVAERGDETSSVCTQDARLGNRG